MTNVLIVDAEKIEREGLNYLLSRVSELSVPVSELLS